MEKTISPSKPITEGQIGKICELVAASLRKNHKEFPSEVVQQVLQSNGAALTEDIVSDVRKYVDASSDLITRVVIVNRNRSGKDALNATGRNVHVIDSVVNKMPNGTTEKTEIVFFKLDRYVNDIDIYEEYELRGLDPADPFSVAAVNEADPAFADEYPHSTYWEDENGKKYFLTFFRFGDVRTTSLACGIFYWVGYWLLAGIRKKPLHVLPY